MHNSLKQKALIRQNQLEANRLDWEGHWKEITDYILPRKGRYAQDPANTPKTSPTTRVDATATKALRLLASGMQGGLTSPTRPWFRMTVPSPDLADLSPVKEWLHKVEEILYQAFARSNFYSSIHTLYTELAAFGTGALYQEEHPEHFFVFRVFTTGSYAIGMGQDCRADSIVRRFWMPARSVAEKWGRENVSRKTRELAEKNPDRFVELCHMLYPRTQPDHTKKDSGNMPFASLYWEKNSRAGSILGHGGYQEFPVMCPRWDVTAEDIYGQSPGLDALPDVKMLQQMAKGEIMALHKMNTPPMMKPAGMKARLNLLPGGENVVNITDPGTSQVRPLYEVKTNIAAVSSRIRELQGSVREWFYNDLFLMLAQRPTMTATEVLERNEEKMLLLGPVIERQQYELLDPLIDRTFNILWRAGALPPPPDALRGRNLKVEYISLLAQAQKTMGIRSIEGASGYVERLAGAFPQVLDRFDPDAALKAYASMAGSPPEILRSDREVDKIRKSRIEESARQAEMQEAMMALRTGQGPKDIPNNNQPTETGEA